MEDGYFSFLLIERYYFTISSISIFFYKTATFLTVNGDFIQTLVCHG